jgi:hypothetical protein
MSSRSLHWVQISQGPVSISGGTNVRPKRGMAGVVACKAASLRPVVLCGVGGSAENLFPDPMKVGYLALKDGQGDEEAI